MFHVYANGTEIYNPQDEDMLLLSPHLILEMGKAGSLEFSIPANNIYYDRLQQLSTDMTVEMDGDELFRGRVLSNTRGFNNTRKIYVEGDLAYLVDSVQKGEKYTGTTHDLFRKIITNHNSRVDASKHFTIGTIGIENLDIVLYGQSDDVEDMETGDIDYRQIVLNSIADEWLNTYDYIESALIDYCGGYLRTRRVGSTVYLDLITDYGNRAIQEIEFGKNILDLTREVSADELFTVLIPLGDENLTIESVNNGSDELVDQAAVAQYGRIVRTHVFNGVNQPSTLLENGQRYLASHINVPVTITVKAVDMHFVDDSVQFINVGDQVHVNSLPHDVFEYLTCTKIEYDLADPSNNVYTFGNPKQSLTERYRKDRRKETGKGGGAGAAVEVADRKADDGLQDFFNAWINVDPDSAHIDLGTLYKDYEHGKLVLQRDCGIDIDGVTGNINIKSLQRQFDEAGQEIAKQGAQINLLQKDTEARIELLVSRYTTLDGEEKGHYAEFVMFANDTESAIAMKADKISLTAMQTELEKTEDQLKQTRDVLTKQCGITLDGTTNNVNINSLFKRVQDDEKLIAENTADIDVMADDLGSKIRLITTAVNDNKARIASVEIKATNLESSIALKADKVTVESVQTSLKATNDKINKTNNVLTKECGIDLNGTTGNVNIKSLSITVNNQGKMISQNSASITTIANNLASQISLVTTSINNNDRRIASVEVKASKLESSIKLKADKVSIDADIIDLKGRIESIEADVASFHTAFAKTIMCGNIKANLIQCTEIAIARNSKIGNYHIITESSYDSWVTGTRNWVKRNFAAIDHKHGLFA